MTTFTKINQAFPFLITDVETHKIMKPQLLADIASMGKHSLIENDQHISNSDWYLPSNRQRPYFDKIKDIFFDLKDQIIADFKYSETTNNLSYWFQQYEKGDYHGWHVHFGCMFSSIYYLDLPEGTAKTTFKVLNEEFQVDVKEGQILTFPSCFNHCSKPNQSDKVKTVIVVNF